MGRPIDADALEMQIDAEQKRLWSNNDKEWEQNKPYYKGLALARRLLLYAPTMPDPRWTNADRIRAMSDEQLAEFLCEFRSCDSSAHPCDSCKGTEYCQPGHVGILDYLKKPAGED